MIVQQPFRPKQQHDNNQQERERILERDGDKSACPGFGNAKDQSADNRAGETIETPKNRGGPAVQPQQWSRTRIVQHPNFVPGNRPAQPGAFSECTLPTPLPCNPPYALRYKTIRVHPLLSVFICVPFFPPPSAQMLGFGRGTGSTRWTPHRPQPNLQNLCFKLQFSVSYI